MLWLLILGLYLVINIIIYLNLSKVVSRLESVYAKLFDLIESLDLEEEEKDV